MISEGELTRGMNQLLDVKRICGELGASNTELIARLYEALVYAQMATGGGTGSIGSTIGVMVRNPGFVLGKA